MNAGATASQTGFSAEPGTTETSIPAVGAITLISGDLGLFDIELAVPEGTPGPSVLLARHHPDGPWVQAHLHPGTGRVGVSSLSHATAHVRSHARVLLGSPRSSVGSASTTKDTLRIDLQLRWADDLGPIGVRFPDGVLLPRKDAVLTLDTSLPRTVHVPAWAMGATWYQIFPERFRNGNPANDPDRAETALRSWTSDWSQTSVHELEQAWAAQHADPRTMQLNRWGNGGVGPGLIFRRRYGGDLQGVVERLDYLDTLGINALYLCPVFDAQSLHKYEAADHRHIDPTMGDPGTPTRASTTTQPMPHDAAATASAATWPWTPADRYFIDTLLPEARARGMRVIIDGVWNHVGLANWAFTDVVERGVGSPYADWFECRFDNDGQLIGWEGWSNTNGALPEFKHTDDGDLNPGIKAFIFDVTRRWMDPNNDGDPSDGIDGWRLDVAAEIGRTFWRDWRAHVRDINPDSLIIGEIWFPGGDYFDGTAWDAQMNYPFAYALADWLALDPAFTSAELGITLTQVHSNAPHTELVQMNLLVSHDTERLASLLMNPGRDYEQGANIRAPGSNYNASMPDESAKQRSVLAAAIKSTWLGSPMIYNGDELGMAGADDPDNRRPLWWPDLGVPADGISTWDPAVFLGYRTWLRNRSNPDFGNILRYGDLSVLPHISEDAFAYQRTLNSRVVRVVANRSGHTLQLDLPDVPGVVLYAPESPVIPPFSMVFWVYDLDD